MGNAKWVSIVLKCMCIISMLKFILDNLLFDDEQQLIYEDLNTKLENLKAGKPLSSPSEKTTEPKSKTAQAIGSIMTSTFPFSLFAKTGRSEA